MNDQVNAIVVHDPLCPMQACEHVRTWCEHECHCDTIADARADERERVAREIEVVARGFDGNAMAVLVGARVARRQLP